MRFLIILAIIIGILGAVYWHLNQQQGDINVGSAAPDFNLPDATGAMRSLHQFKGQWVVLYFYPKDDTPGCTKEACSFRDDLAKLEKLGAQVIGISVDNGESHAAFAKKYHLPFPLLSDQDGTVANQYHALTNLGVAKIAKRYTFLIDPKGNIAKAYYQVDTSRHSEEIIQDLTRLKQP